jgi:DNA adenine methylase
VIAGKIKSVDALVQRLNVKPTLEMWHSVKAHKPANDVDRAFKAIFMNRTSWNGIIQGARPIGGLGQTSAWAVGCRYNVSALVNLVYTYHALLAGRATITCLDAVVFLKQHPHPCYVDPPYLMKGKNALYGVDMTADEHRHFAQVLRSARKWVLTYDLKDKIACDLYFGEQKSLIDTRYSMDTGHRAHRRDVNVAEWKKASEICAWKGF